MSVLYRMFAVTPRMEPVGADAQNQPEVSIYIEIVVFLIYQRAHN